MVEVGIRALKQNASAVIAEVVHGQSVIITDRGRAVAQLNPIASTRVEQLMGSGLIRKGRGRLAELPAPEPGEPLTPVLSPLRDEERY
ncbi:type II toxin-antitoxin system Phd/YefM family antitoxin [Humibacter antri]